MPNDTFFCKGFTFRLLKFKNYRFSDSRSGIPVNYLAYMVCGNAKIVTEEETVTISEGEVFYIPNGCKYRSYWYGEPNIEFISLAFPFLPNFENRRYEPQVIPASREEIDLMYEIVNEPTENPVGVGKLYLLIGKLMPNMAHRKKGKVEELVDKAGRIIYSDPKKSVKEVAKICAVSQSALFAAFKRRSDKSLGEIRRESIMKKSKDALISTDTSIEEIAISLGFCSGAYFRKCFKDYFGISPREMRKTNSLL